MAYLPPVSFDSLTTLIKRVPQIGLRQRLSPALGFHMLTCEEMMQDSRQQSPHCHDFFQVIHVEAGFGSHCVDYTSTSLVPPCVFCLHPLQTHSWTGICDLQGTILAFQEDFLTHSIQSSLSLHVLPIFRILGNTGGMQLTPVQNEEFCRLIREIAREHTGFDSRHPHLLGAMVLALLARLQRWQSDRIPSSEQSAIELMQRLEAYLQRTVSAEMTLSDCSSAINTSPQLLSKCVRTVTGLSFSRFFHNKILHHAKLKLSTTDMTISEIAFQLGFKDPSYFCRFFKRLSGKTPLQFRRQ